MLDCRQERELKPVPGLVFGLAGALATASIVALAAFAAPRPADALPAYATQTKLACGRCHVSAAGGGALTGFGKAFAANGHKVPSRGGKAWQNGGATSSRSGPNPHPWSTPERRGTGLRRYYHPRPCPEPSATFECFNCGVFCRSSVIERFISYTDSWRDEDVSASCL